MEHSQLLTEALIFLLAAVVVVPLLHQLRTSPILGYLVAGLLIGPHGLGFIGSTTSAAALAEFGVVFLLFAVGLELSLERLIHAGRYVFGLGLAQVLVSGAAITLAAALIGFDIKAAAIIGGALALSSTAFVLQLLEERRERTTQYGFLTFAVLLLQDLAVVPLLLMVGIFAREEASLLAALGLALVQAVIALLLVIVLGKRVLRPVIHAVAGTRSAELFVAVTLLAVLGTGWLLSLAGLSMGLGAFLAGLLLAETPYRHQVEADIRPFRGLLLGLFFMTIGMAIDAAFILQHLAALALIVSALLIGKAAIATLLCRLFGAPIDTALRSGLALAQGGEFGFVLIGAAATLGLLPPQTVQLLLAAIALSLAATPGLLALGGWLAARLKSAPPAQGADTAAELAGIGNHIILAGFGRVGQTCAKVLADAGIPYVGLDLDRDLVIACRVKGMPVYYGNSSEIRVLHSTGLERAAGVVITLDEPRLVNRLVAELRNSYPELRIFVRARDIRHLRRLETAGATATVLETAEASLQLGAIVINTVEPGSDLTAGIIDSYRQNDYALLEDIIGRSAR